MKSKIFTELELSRLNQFMKGIRKDKDGLFSARIKPKINELINEWFPKERKLKKLIGQ